MVILKIGNRLQVLNGIALKTKGGYTKKELYYNDNGKIVIKKLKKNKNINNIKGGANYLKLKKSFRNVGLVTKKNTSVKKATNNTNAQYVEIMDPFKNENKNENKHENRNEIFNKNKLNKCIVGNV